MDQMCRSSSYMYSHSMSKLPVRPSLNEPLEIGKRLKKLFMNNIFNKIELPKIPINTADRLQVNCMISNSKELQNKFLKFPN